MQPRDAHWPRRRLPDLERDFTRSPTLGFEPPDTGTVRCLAHGFPTPLARWHVHDDYELHLITATSGKAFVGDWIGPFQPGHLVLVGPRLPHNWISDDVPPQGVAERDLVIHFPHEPIVQAAQYLPELAELQPLLDRARYGIEFFECSQRAQAHWHAIKRGSGVERFAAFCAFLAELSRWSDYRLLSSVQMEGGCDDSASGQINALVNRIMRDYAQPLSATELAAELGMTESRFSRFFKRATGNTFRDFVNRIRVSRAGHLLMESDHQITHICYEVGFNNVANFNRRFLEVKGVTPSEFRRQAVQRFGSGRVM
ncbi:AraC family transcriptional regulator [Piscinibacter terrae]|uniref:Helix-turn-helix domain-containing protein n=1 Tax=Piscinibacter terrae TaxID=2496871 RepID=A0A3N7HQD6_9BURK|nr:helix-turn-helix domain-containing protein [Albitalea terrae]RQP23366.1 helix-turn-helix domain-containing protein [Albitalea terrae]